MISRWTPACRFGSLVVIIALSAVGACRRSPPLTPPLPARADARATVSIGHPNTPTRRATERATASRPVGATTEPDAATSAPVARVSPSATIADVGGLSLGTPSPGPARVEGGTIGGSYDLIDVRVGRHAGFTRVVWQMVQPEGTPHYVTRLEQSDGAWRLAVELTDVSAFEAPQALEPEAGPEGGGVVSVRTLPVRDDALLAFAVALQGPVRYEVTTLQGPVRLVIDVFDVGP